VTRLTPDLAANQVMWLFVSIAAMVAVLWFVRDLDWLANYKFTIGLAGLILLVLPMLIGREENGSKLWLTFGGFSFQPGEIAKILIVLFLASYLSENREALSASAMHVGPFTVPRPRMLAPMIVMWGMCLLVVVFERDLGCALLFYVMFVVMLYVATGRLSYSVLSLVLLAIGGVICYTLFAHVRTRISIWLDPFADASGSGLQIVQSLYSIADGDLVGTRHRQGPVHAHPLVQSDFIFSAIGEELGLLGASAVLMALHAARRARARHRRARQVRHGGLHRGGPHHLISFQAFLIVPASPSCLPLTGVTLPFMSQGGSSLLSSFIIVALLLRAGDEGTGRENELKGSGVGNAEHRLAPWPRLAHRRHRARSAPARQLRDGHAGVRRARPCRPQQAHHRARHVLRGAVRGCSSATSPTSR
jgi:peptidoglycan glycosyltransferase